MTISLFAFRVQQTERVCACSLGDGKSALQELMSRTHSAAGRMREHPTCARWRESLAAITSLYFLLFDRLARSCRPLFSLLQPDHGVAGLCALCLEPDLIADLDLLEHRRILDAVDHGHGLIHAEALGRAVLESD